MRLGLIVVGLLLLIILLIGGQVMGAREQMATLRQTVETTWAQVDTVVQRRMDLIPGLLALTKDLAGSREKEIPKAIAAARTGLLNARNPEEKIQSNQSLDHAIGRLLIAAEINPQLRDNEGFERMVEDLAAAENRIAQDRRRYNEAVQKYNTTIEMFPNNIAAALFGFRRNDAYFRTDPASRQAVPVRY